MFTGEMPHRFLQDCWRGAAVLYDWGKVDQGLKTRQRLYLVVDALTPPLFIAHTVMGALLKMAQGDTLKEAKNLLEVLRIVFPHLLGVEPVKVVDKCEVCYFFFALLKIVPFSRCSWSPSHP